MAIVLSLLLLVLRENSNKDRVRSLSFFFFFQNGTSLLFVDLYHYCAAAEVLGEGSGLAV